jgi:hypothetical protein
VANRYGCFLQEWASRITGKESATMRKALQQIDGVRTRFIGTFSRFGIKNGYKGPLRTVLLIEIMNESGKIITDHLWFNLTKGFERLDLREGDRIEFFARVKEYEKGYVGRRDDVYKALEIDYKLSHPTKMRKL